MKRVTFSALLTTSVLAVATTTARAQEADVIHWWTSARESKAVAALAEKFEAAGGTWSDAAVAGTDAARTAVSTRIQAGDPPAAFVASAVLEYQDMARTGQIANLDAVAAEMDWENTIPASLLDAVKVDGHYWGAPVNMSVNNFLWTSRKALEAIGETEPPKTWDELFEMSDRLKEVGIIPYAHPGKWYWDLNTFGFILASQSPEAFSRFHSLDPEVFDDPAVLQAAEIYAKLRDYSDSGAPGREWNLSNQMVMNGEAAFYLMGDWAKGEITAAGMTPGEEVICTVSLDDAPAAISGDAMLFPSLDGSTEPSPAQLLLAETLTSVDAQVAFNTLKGSMPVRTDAPTDNLDACSRLALEHEKAHGSVSAYPALLSGDAAGSFGDVLGNFWVDSGATAEDLVYELQDTASLFN